MHEDDHGHSRAAWAGVAIMIVSSAIACWGVMFGPMVLFWVGSALFVGGALAWYVLARAGWGGTTSHAPAPATSKSQS